MPRIKSVAAIHEYLMRIVVLSDTHIPSSAQDLDERIYKEIEESDLILHAGDLISAEFFNKLKALKNIRAVKGNMDEPLLSRILPPKEKITLGKYTIGLIHGYGAPQGILDTARNEFLNEKVDMIIFGHSHQPLKLNKGGILFFNPGSPTDKIYAKTNTYGIITVTNGIINAQIKQI